MSAAHAPLLLAMFPRFNAVGAVVWHQVMINPLLQLAFGGIILVLAGHLLGRATPLFAGFMRGIGNLALIAGLLLSLARVMHYDTGLGLPNEAPDQVQVTGKETRASIDDDGHFWIRGTIDGVPVRFLVDTGATITTLSTQVAEQAGLEPDRDAPEIALNTANGTVTATRTRIAHLKIGNIAARDIEAVVSPGIGGTNVLGMNFLSRLASWRVEGKALILVPHHPQADGDLPDQ